MNKMLKYLREQCGKSLNTDFDSEFFTETFTDSCPETTTDTSSELSTDTTQNPPPEPPPFSTLKSIATQSNLTKPQLEPANLPSLNQDLNPNFPYHQNQKPRQCCIAQDKHHRINKGEELLLV